MEELGHTVTRRSGIEVEAEIAPPPRRKRGKIREQKSAQRKERVESL